MKRLYLILVALLPLLATSCLNTDVDESQYSRDCDINSISFEHRWAVQSEVDGIWTLNFKELQVESTIDKDKNVITVDIKVPAADASYPESERGKTDISSLACSFFVSNAAKVTPLQGAPQLGKLGDFSAKAFRYRVTSASGLYKDWNIIINSFTK